MPDYIVFCEIPFFVRRAETRDDAISIAIAEVGKFLNKNNLDKADIEVSQSRCPSCGGLFESVLMIGTQALVGIEVSLKIFNAVSEEHAIKITKKKLGAAVGERPIEILSVKRISV